ncbi:MAG: hypothetical protein PHD37_17380 [Gallionellaceae bacterium]|nr:hypothetical protein [Gallionellaceae bacterium]
MKNPSLLDKLYRFFDKKRRRQEAKIRQLKVLLKSLKKQEVKLREKMEKSRDSTRKEHFERQAQVLHEQRKKGIALRRELSNNSKQPKAEQTA